MFGIATFGDSLLSIAGLCSEMRFLDRESLRVVLLDAKQHLIKVVSVSQGTLNEAHAILAKYSSQ